MIVGNEDEGDTQSPNASLQELPLNDTTQNPSFAAVSGFDWNEALQSSGVKNFAFTEDAVGDECEQSEHQVLAVSLQSQEEANDRDRLTFAAFIDTADDYDMVQLLHRAALAVDEAQQAIDTRLCAARRARLAIRFSMGTVVAQLQENRFFAPLDVFREMNHWLLWFVDAWREKSAREGPLRGNLGVLYNRGHAPLIDHVREALSKASTVRNMTRALYEVLEQYRVSVEYDLIKRATDFVALAREKRFDFQLRLVLIDDSWVRSGACAQVRRGIVSWMENEVLCVVKSAKAFLPRTSGTVDESLIDDDFVAILRAKEAAKDVYAELTVMLDAFTHAELSNRDTTALHLMLPHGVKLDMFTVGAREFVVPRHIVYSPATDDVQRWLRSGSMPSAPDVLTVVADVACGLGELHARRLVHCDLSISNCLLVTDMMGHQRGCLGDFGMVRRVSSVSTPNEGLSSPFARPPEMSLPLVTFAITADMWSFGMTLAELYSVASRISWSDDLFSILDPLLSAFRGDPHDSVVRARVESAVQGALTEEEGRAQCAGGLRAELAVSLLPVVGECLLMNPEKRITAAQIAARCRQK
jgi:hypothetical protein